MSKLPALPRTGSETEVLLHFLDYYRAVARRKAEGLEGAELRRTVAASTLTIGGILKHLAFVEDWWLVAMWEGSEAPDPWTRERFAADEDWDFHSAAHDSPDYLLGLYDERTAAARAKVHMILAEHPDGLDAAAASQREGEYPTLRWILVHLIEEYARHCGHLDLLREAVDGVTGD